jgi:hypothetical protein
VLVAITLLASGILAVVTVFDSSRNLTTVGAKNEIATHVAEDEMEDILARPWGDVGLAGDLSGLCATDPDVQDCSSTPKYKWNGNASASEELCGSGSGCDTPQIQPTGTWSSGSASGTIARYVSWVNDPSSGPCTNCIGPRDYKRVTLKVTIDGPQAPKKPVMVSTIIFDPSAGPGPPP